MALKVYFDLLSQPSRAVILMLRFNKIPHTECPIALRKAEHFSDEYTAVNPMQLVPYIDDNGFKLGESVAILKYLAIKYKLPDHWYYPNDFVKQLRVDEYLNWQHVGLRVWASMYFRTKVIEKPLNTKRLEEMQEHLERNLEKLQNVYLSKGPFVNGMSDISIADLLCICELEQPLAVGFDLLTNRPALREYMDRVKAKLGPHYDDVNKIIRKLNDAFLKGKL